MVMKEANLFEDLDQNVVEEIKKIMVEMSYEENHVLFDRGESAHYFYILTEGKVMLAIGEYANMSHMVESPGDAFGWSSLVEHHVYTASAVCLTPTKVLRIKNETLFEIFERHPTDAFIFYRRLAGIIGRRLMTSYNFLLRTHGKTSRYLKSMSSA